MDDSSGSRMTAATSFCLFPGQDFDTFRGTTQGCYPGWFSTSVFLNHCSLSILRGQPWKRSSHVRTASHTNWCVTNGNFCRGARDSFYPVRDPVICNAMDLYLFAINALHSHFLTCNFFSVIQTNSSSRNTYTRPSVLQTESSVVQRAASVIQRAHLYYRETRLYYILISCL